MKSAKFLFLSSFLLCPFAWAGEPPMPIANFADPFHPEAFVQFSDYGEPLGAKIFLADSNGAPQSQAYLEVPGLQNILQGVAFHQGHLYTAVMVGEYPLWKRELWRYDENKKGTKLYEGKIDGSFLVSSDESYIALVDSDGTETGRRLSLLNPKNGSLLKTFTPRQLGLTQGAEGGFFNLLAFYGGALWACDGEEDGDPVSHFTRLEEGTWKMTSFEPKQVIDGIDAFNPFTHLLLYDDYPPFQDTEDDRRFRETKTEVNLYLYDVEAGKRTLIATVPAWRFYEQWTGKDVFEYNDPNGKGRVRKKISSVP